MNQQCKVCGEPAAGFHFGAFTCEGCKSFFGRSYNNLSSISECKSGGECVINKKNRTACKACRLRKCLLVGMSKSGSRYGRRSNWFKIHCLLQEQQQQQQQQAQQHHPLHRHHHHHHHHEASSPQPPPPLPPLQHENRICDSRQRSSPAPTRRPALERRSKEDTRLDDYKNSTSPSVSSPESHNSDGSVEVSERRAAYALHPGFRPLHPVYTHGNNHLSALGKEMMNFPSLGFHLGGVPLLTSSFLPPPGLTVFSPYLYGAAAAAAAASAATMTTSATSTTSPIASPASLVIGEPIDKKSNDEEAYRNAVANNNNNNNNRNARDHNNERRNDVSTEKRFYLDAVLESQRTPPRRTSPSSLSARACQADRVVPPQEDPMDLSLRANSAEDTLEVRHENDGPPSKRRPVDLTTRS